MTIPRYPCRVCEKVTVAQDAYTVYPECLDGLEQGSHQPTVDQHEIEARLRKLLDDW